MSIRSQINAPAADPDSALIAALIESCSLSQEQVARVRELMDGRSMSFADAAMDLNLVTADQAAAAATRSRAPNVIENALQRLSVGRVATVPPPAYGKPSAELLLVHNPDHPHCERVRALRTEMLLLLGDERRQASAIAVLSPGPGDGRSLLSAELAIAFAQLGRRTLLIEADLRRPRQHVLFGVPLAAGMAQSLASGREPRLVRIEGLEHLSVLTAGPAPPNPLELLSEGRFERLLSGWRLTFDILVIDTPAVSQFADGLAIASFAQQVLLLGRANVTPHKDMKDVLRRLVSTRAQILGAVINDF